jgi:hypothetical protein
MGYHPGRIDGSFHNLAPSVTPSAAMERLQLKQVEGSLGRGLSKSPAAIFSPLPLWKQTIGKVWQYIYIPPKSFQKRLSVTVSRPVRRDHFNGSTGRIKGTINWKISCPSIDHLGKNKRVAYFCCATNISRKFSIKKTCEISMFNLSLMYLLRD